MIQAVALVIDAPGNLVDMFRGMADVGKSANLSKEEKEVKLNEIRWKTYDNHQIKD
jgi:hypothetical protein